MMKRYGPVILGILVGGCISGLVLYLPQNSQANDEPILSLFGWPRLLLAHVLSTLPLSLLTSLSLRNEYFPQRSWRNIVLMVIGGISLAVIFRWIGPSLGIFLDPESRSYFVRLLLRVACCLSLQVPWCLLGLLCVPRSGDMTPNDFPVWSRWALVVAIGVVLPGVYASSVIQSETNRLNTLPMWLAERAIERVQELGSDPLVQGTRVSAIRKQLNGQLRRCEKVVSAPLPPNGSVEEQLKRSNCLIGLGRYAEAESLLQQFASDNPKANLLLGSLHQAQKKWTASSEAYRHALTLLGSESDHKEEQIIAYNALAFNLREQQKHAEAAKVYQEAMSQLPTQQAFFHFQLGRHYESTGRLPLAGEQFEQAAALEPEQFGKQSQAWLTAIAQKSPGCFLGTSGRQ